MSNFSFSCSGMVEEPYVGFTFIADFPDNPKEKNTGRFFIPSSGVITNCLPS